MPRGGSTDRGCDGCPRRRPPGHGEAGRPPGERDRPGCRVGSRRRRAWRSCAGLPIYTRKRGRLPPSPLVHARFGQARCCLILPSRVALGTFPMTVSTCFPPLKKRMLGMERTLNRIAVWGFASTSTLATLARPAYSPASCSSTGATIRHGPHHDAQKSTRTSPPACSISLLNEASVTWTVGLFVAAMVLFSCGLKPFFSSPEDPRGRRTPYRACRDRRARPRAGPPILSSGTGARAPSARNGGRCDDPVAVLR